MNPVAPAPPEDPAAEIPRLIETLLATERRLVELTAGEVDAVVDRDGRTFLLQRAQEQLRHSEATKQATILNALPAHIALLDAQGLIISVNEAWQRFGRSGGLPNQRQAEGVNYLAICDETEGPGSADALAAAAGIRTVLAGTVREFSLEYPCHAPTAQCWFLMLVTPLMNDHVNGAVVMHVDVTDRKKAEEATRESNERFAGAFEQASIGVALVGPDGRWLRVNQALCELVGYSEAELMVRTFQDITHPADLAKDLELVRRMLADEIRSYQLEKRYLHARGHEISVLLNVSLVHDAQCRPGYFIAQIQDITERKRAAARLEESQHRLTLAAKSARLGIWEWDILTNKLVWDEQMYVLYGVPQKDFSGAFVAWKNGLHPEDRKRSEAEIFAAVESGNGFHTEFRIVRPDGEVREIEAHAEINRASDGSFVRMVGVNWDITERKRITGKLHESEKRFKALFEQAAVGVAQVEAATGRFVHVNQRFADIVGRSLLELVDLTINTVTCPPDWDHTQEMMQRLRVGTLREFTCEKRYLRPDGSIVWATLTVSAMWAAGEEPSLCIGVVQDITGRKQLEDQLRQAHKMEAIGTLAGGIAHDFNNILAAIGGYTELARMKLQDNPGVREHLDAVGQAVKRAAALVRQILTFSREQPLERRLIQLQPVVAECVKLLRATLPATIELDLVVVADAPTVFADETQVHQILMNLVTNARHAIGDRPGRIQLKVESCMVDEVYAAAQSRLHPGLYARVSVSDTGKGMDAETQRRLFEPFFTTKGPGEGTGLGLAVVHGIMDSHDGVITVYSQPGEGTVFQLYFPAQAAEAALTPRAEPTGPHGHGERVLFVDDEELLAKLGEQALRVLGYEVEVTREPAVALARVRANPQGFALVVTDQAMPGMTGLQLAAELRQIRPDLPIILTTGYSLTLTAERVRAAGIQQLLLKPTTIQSLGEAVHAALSGQPLATHASNPPY